MSSVAETILDVERQGRAEDFLEGQKIRNRLRACYVALLAQAISDPTGVDQLRLLDMKNELEISPADFLEDSEAMQKYFALLELDRGKADAEHDYISAVEARIALEKAQKLALIEARKNADRAVRAPCKSRLTLATSWQSLPRKIRSFFCGRQQRGPPENGTEAPAARGKNSKK